MHLYSHTGTNTHVKTLEKARQNSGVGGLSEHFDSLNTFSIGGFCWSWLQAEGSLCYVVLKKQPSWLQHFWACHLEQLYCVSSHRKVGWALMESP